MVYGPVPKIPSVANQPRVRLPGALREKSKKAKKGSNSCSYLYDFCTTARFGRSSEDKGERSGALVSGAPGGEHALTEEIPGSGATVTKEREASPQRLVIETPTVAKSG